MSSEEKRALRRHQIKEDLLTELRNMGCVARDLGGGFRVIGPNGSKVNTVVSSFRDLRKLMDTLRGEQHGDNIGKGTLESTHG
jgi:hypothetical protein